MDGEPIVPGAGGAPGGDGGGDGGGVAVADPPAPVIPGVEGGGDGAPPAGEETPPGEPEGGDPEASLEQDGRIVDVKTRQQIAELRKSNPALAKVAADAVFGRQAIMKEFPEAKTLGDALKSIRAVNQTLEAIGGEEGITKLQTDVTQYEKEIGQFSAGDPDLVAQLHEGNPEGFVKTTANALSLLFEKNNAQPGDLFDQAITPMFNTKLQRAGLPTAMADLLGLIEKGDGDGSKDLALRIQKWMKDVDGYAKSLHDGKDVKDPKAEALTAREQNLQKAEATRYETDVATDVNKLNNEAMAPLLESLFKKLNLGAEGKQEFTKLLQSRVWAAMKADKVFQRNARNIKAKGDVAATGKFVNAKFVELLSGQDGIFTRVRNQMYPHLATAAKKGPTPPAGTRPPGSPAPPVVKVEANARPKHDDVDWNKTSDINWIRGVAILKNGKEHKFDPNSPPNRI